MDPNRTANDEDDMNPCTLPGAAPSPRRPECGTPEVLINTTVIAVTEAAM
eukprot:SAG31_NODE_27620_length_423_cov_0.641975_1_plen_49_part_10